MIYHDPSHKPFVVFKAIPAQWNQELQADSQFMEVESGSELEGLAWDGHGPFETAFASVFVWMFNDVPYKYS